MRIIIKCAAKTGLCVMLMSLEADQLMEGGLVFDHCDSTGAVCFAALSHLRHSHAAAVSVKLL